MTDPTTSPHDRDALLTAYALGELTGPDREAVEGRLATDPAARAEVERIRQAAADLAAALADEPGADLTAQQRARVLAAGRPPRRWLSTPRLALAAGVLLAVSLAGNVVLWATRPAAAPPPQALAEAEVPAEDADPAAVDPASAAGEDATTVAEAERPGPAEVPSPEVRADPQSEPEQAAARMAAERARAEEVQRLLQRALELRLDMQYDEALAVLDRALSLEPENKAAQAMKTGLEDALAMALPRHRVLTRSIDLPMASAARPDGRYVPVVKSTSEEEPVPDAIGFAVELQWVPAESAPEPPGHGRLAPLRSPGDIQEEQQLNNRVERRLQDVAPARFNRNRLLNVLAYVEKVGGVRILVNWQALAALGVQEDTPITMDRNDASIHEILQGILAQAVPEGEAGSIDYAIINGMVVVSTPEDLERRQHPHRAHTETYDRVIDNPFLAAMDNPLSTFSVDVDTASYANVRRFLMQQAQLPPPDAVRIEELVNYFEYDDAGPEGAVDEAGEPVPFAVHVGVASSPWRAAHRLVRIALQGREVPVAQRPAANLVFLLDVSGSMRPANKLPLVKQAMRELVAQLRPDDRVAIAVYAGASGLVLDSTTDHDAVIAAINRLEAGGATHGAAGIELAYQVATQHFIQGGINRVILCTDGDFNVGITDRGQLTRLIEDKARAGVHLSILGFGMGNLKDATLEELSNRGDGHYAYIDSLDEARRVLVQQVGGTLMTIAKDVKVQIEFNPAKVAAYRLIGYENRLLAREDFNDDTRDAGDIGSGHSVTALYEIVPAPADGDAAVGDLAGVGRTVDALKYQRPAQLTEVARAGDELLTLKLRYKEPDAPKEQGTSKLIEVAVTDPGTTWAEASADFRFAAAVAGFGMLLRDSPYRGEATYERVLAWARDALGEGERAPADRREFITLIERARQLAGPVAP